MDTRTLRFPTPTACLAGVAFRPWRLRNEKRDAVPLGPFSGPMGGAAPAMTAILRG